MTHSAAGRVDDTLASLAEVYRVERDYRAFAHQSAEPGRCRYCGSTLIPYAGKMFDGHTHCIVGEGFKRHLYEVMSDDVRLTYAKVGGALGVSVAVVRKWFHRGWAAAVPEALVRT